MTVKTCEEQMELHKGNPEMLELWTSKRAGLIARHSKYAHLRVHSEQSSGAQRPKSPGQPKPEPKEKPKDGKKPKR